MYIIVYWDILEYLLGRGCFRMNENLVYFGDILGGKFNKDISCGKKKR